MTNEGENPKSGFGRLLLSSIVPVFFIFICWMIFILDLSLGLNLWEYGLHPRDIYQWYGILTMPFLHSGLDHLVSNSISFIVLGTMLFYFYRKDALQVFIWSYLLSGLFTWLIGRDSIHIGASAMIYAFAGYLFTAGVLSKNRSQMAVALIIVFMYGSMIWGVVPQNTGISWEGHLSGLFVGIILSFIYRPPKYIEPGTETENEVVYTEFGLNDYDCTENDEVELRYFYKQEKKTAEDKKEQNL